MKEERRIFLSLVFHRRAFQYFPEYGGYIEHVLTVLAECRIREGMYFAASGAYVFCPLCASFRTPAMGYARVPLRIPQFQTAVRQVEAVERVEVRYPFLMPSAGGHFHRQRCLDIISGFPFLPLHGIQYDEILCMCIVIVLAPEQDACLLRLLADQFGDECV